MKMRYGSLFRVFFLLLALLPVASIVAFCFGYTFEVFNYSFFAILAAITGVKAVLEKNSEEEFPTSKLDVMFSIVCAPLSLITCLFYLAKSRFFIVVLSMIVCIGCSFYITIVYGRPKIVKVIISICSAILLIPFGFILFVSLVFGSIGKNTVVQTIHSPDESRYVEVVDSDQGALGGNTLFDVYEKDGIDAFIFGIKKNPKQIYRGAWGEFKDMQIAWKNDTTVIINGVEYDVE